MDKYGHIYKTKDRNLFFDHMLCGKKLLSKKEKEEIEASYFAMCLLLPEESFKQLASMVGGLEEAFVNPDKIAHFCDVEPLLVQVRAKDLLERAQKEQKVSVKVKFKRKSKKNKA